MKFDDLDKKMRVFETLHDQYVLPGIYVVARIDGRSFTRLTKEVHKFDAPFDERFRDYMVETTQHLMTCGFRVLYGYTESDEISLLFDLEETAYGRKHRKWNSLLAGEASAKFSSLLGSPGAFDCRLSELPDKKLVVDYFRWRNEDAHRNALNAHCYWKLRAEKFSRTEATKRLEQLPIADKNELLFSYGINFNKLPAWQKRGIGVYWKEIEREGLNPKSGQKTITRRRELFTEYHLPMKAEYDSFLADRLNEAEKLRK
jgi:tRNA(His) guanylyltransferase